jgi:UDP-N-acetylglucosamine/UDP-N-acetylgalactosamine diphosphorylase
MPTADLAVELKSIDQSAVLRFADQLDDAGRAKLTAQLGALDLADIARLADEYVRSKPHVALPKDIQPVKAFPRVADPANAELYKRATATGHDLIAAGKVAAFLVAGGQGTRLGYDGPKGEYPVTPVRAKPLFQVFAEQLLNYGKTFGKPVPWYLMTSDVNDAATRAFFERHGYFGLDKGNVVFFQQGMMPAFSMDGQLLLGERDSLALSPDGHGGSLRALYKSGAIADMKKRGVEHLSYFQVDNPLVHVIDPLFIGLHAITASQMSTKTVTKANALEKVGNLVIGDGATQVIEYSDLPAELAQQTNTDGSLRFNAGSIGLHALTVEFVEHLNTGGQLKLPWHRAEKKVPYVDEAGKPVKPTSPNAVKLEQFVFDAIPLARNAMVYTTDRAEEFSPVKNAEGVDSPATSRRDQVRRAARWLAAAGVAVPTEAGEPAATVEISPLFAVSADQLRGKTIEPRTIRAGESVYYG